MVVFIGAASAAFLLYYFVAHVVLAQVKDGDVTPKLINWAINVGLLFVGILAAYFFGSRFVQWISEAEGAPKLSNSFFAYAVGTAVLCFALWIFGALTRTQERRAKLHDRHIAFGAIGIATAYFLILWLAHWVERKQLPEWLRWVVVAVVALAILGTLFFLVLALARRIRHRTAAHPAHRAIALGASILVLYVIAIHILVAIDVVGRAELPGNILFHISRSYLASVALAQAVLGVLFGLGLAYWLGQIIQEHHYLTGRGSRKFDQYLGLMLLAVFGAGLFYEPVSDIFQRVTAISTPAGSISIAAAVGSLAPVATFVDQCENHSVDEMRLYLAYLGYTNTYAFYAASVQKNQARATDYAEALKDVTESAFQCFWFLDDLSQARYRAAFLDTYGFVLMQFALARSPVDGAEGRDNRERLHIARRAFEQALLIIRPFADREVPRFSKKTLFEPVPLNDLVRVITAHLNEAMYTLQARD
jgi:lipid-A-disaccharide synthase-like uncharacterized protein